MEECNGWANYPTWALYNWILNDRNRYISIHDYIHELYEEYDGDLGFVRDDLINMLKEYTEFYNPLIEEESSVYKDILEWAIGIIDYFDIASAIVDGEEW